MRKFNQNFAACVNEQEYNVLMYDRPTRYMPCEIEFERDIRMILYKRHMEEYIASHSGMCEKFKYGDYLIDIAKNHIGLLYNIVYYEYGNKVSDSVSQQIRQNFTDYIKEYSIRRSLTVGIKEKTTKFEEWADKKCVRGTIQDMFNFLDCLNNTFVLTKRVLPRDMIPVIKNYIKTIYKYLVLKTEPTFITDEEYISDEEQDYTQKGLFIKDKAIILRNLYFDDSKKLYELLHGISTKGMLPTTVQPAVLDSCCFEYPSKLRPFLMLKCPVLFRNCHFQKRFSWFIHSIWYGITFDNCVISDALELEVGSDIEIYFNDCIFEKGSQLKIKWKNERDVNKFTVSITDCVFHDGFEITSKLGIKLTLNNVTFYKPFVTKDLKLDKKSKISNLCFPSVSSPEMEASKKELYNTLVASELKEMADGLNLLSKQKGKENKPKFDYAAYQAEYNTGWLQSKNAAYLLGRGDNYLSKKRMADKKKITRTTIPYRGKGKNIQYPVDALLAFKAQDWNKLRELRKKYNFTGEE